MSGWLWPEPPPPPPPPSPIEAWGPDIIWATGWLGFCGSLILTQLSTAKTLGFAQAINNVLFVIHFLFLGAWGGVASQVVGVANGVLKYHHENATCRKLHSFLPLALIPLTAYTYEKPLDLLPSLAVGGRLLAFRAQSMMHTRLGCTLALTPWGVYRVSNAHFLLSQSISTVHLLAHYLGYRLIPAVCEFSLQCHTASQ